MRTQLGIYAFCDPHAAMVICLHSRRSAYLRTDVLCKLASLVRGVCATSYRHAARACQALGRLGDFNAGRRNVRQQLPTLQANMYIVYPHFEWSLNWHLADSVVPKESRGSKSFENLVISTTSQKREPSKNSDYAQLSANMGHFTHRKSALWAQFHL